MRQTVPANDAELCLLLLLLLLLRLTSRQWLNEFRHSGTVLSALYGTVCARILCC